LQFHALLFLVRSATLTPTAHCLAVLVFVAWLLNNRGNSSTEPPSTPSGRRSLLVISMDGFRANYMQSHAQFLPNIRVFFRDGVKSQGGYPSTNSFNQAGPFTEITAVKT
jgi:hypothetical protein